MLASVHLVHLTWDFMAIRANRLKKRRQHRTSTPPQPTTRNIHYQPDPRPDTCGGLLCLDRVGGTRTVPSIKCFSAQLRSFRKNWKMRDPTKDPPSGDLFLMNVQILASDSDPSDCDSTQRLLPSLRCSGCPPENAAGPGGPES